MSTQVTSTWTGASSHDTTKNNYFMFTRSSRIKLTPLIIATLRIWTETTYKTDLQLNILAIYTTTLHHTSLHKQPYNYNNL